MPVKLSRGRFERLVVEALVSIPEPLRQRLDNVEVVIDDEATTDQLAQAGLEPGDELFGLYEGTPLIERGVIADALLPDKITIFQRPLQAACASEEELREQIRITVIHEIAHYFGFDEDRLSDLGYD